MVDLPRSESAPEDPAARAATTRGKHVAALVEWAELLPAAETLARAFRDNPLNAAVIQAGAGKRYRSNLAGMRSLLDVALGHAVLLAVHEAGARGGERDAPAGILIGAEPYGYPLPGPTLSGHLRCLVRQGPRAMGRWAQVYRALEVAHPLEPHWYLAVLGVAPEHQRLGNGAALLRAFLQKVDAKRAPSYLETDRHENIAFYAQAGYQVAREVSVLDVPVWCMWRPAR